MCTVPICNCCRPVGLRCETSGRLLLVYGIAACVKVTTVAQGPQAGHRGRPEWPTNTHLHAITTCRASRAITVLFHGLASKQLWKGAFFLHHISFCFWIFFAAMLKWSLKLVSFRSNTRLWVYATRHYNHEYWIRFFNFRAADWEEDEKQKECQVVILKKKIQVPCSFSTPR